MRISTYFKCTRKNFANISHNGEKLHQLNTTIRLRINEFSAVLHCTSA
jgi:hypothetical protein